MASSGKLKGALVHSDELAFVVFKKWTNPGQSLFIFILLKHNISGKNVGFNGIRTLIVIVEGKYADHLTTTTAHDHYHLVLMAQICSAIIYFLRAQIIHKMLYLFVTDSVFQKTFYNIDPSS